MGVAQVAQAQAVKSQLQYDGILLEVADQGGFALRFTGGATAWLFRIRGSLVR